MYTQCQSFRWKLKNSVNHLGIYPHDTKHLDDWVFPVLTGMVSCSFRHLLFKISNIARYIQFYIACCKREHRSISFISSLGNFCKKTDMWLLTLKNSEPRGKSKADYDECPNERTKEFKAKMNSESFQGFKDEVAFDQDFILKQSRGRCSQWKRKSAVWFM